MKITTVPCGAMQANCYIVEGENEALIIDPGYLESDLIKFVSEHPDKIKYILLTHRHFDHVNGAVALRKLSNAPVVIHKDDECGLYSDEDSLADLCREFYGHAEASSRADVLISDGDEIKTDEFRIKVIHTPGHSTGGVCYYINGILFSGDILFKGTIGRYDFPGGNYFEIIESVTKLGSLFPDETAVYPGHGEATTIGAERRSNPFFK